jgi:hypothetical protein
VNLAYRLKKERKGEASSCQRSRTFPSTESCKEERLTLNVSETVDSSNTVTNGCRKQRARQESDEHAPAPTSFFSQTARATTY